MKIFKIFGLVLFVFLGACADMTQEKSTEILSTSVVTTYIVTDNVIRLHEVPAVFLATNRADLSFQLSGTVDQVFVKIGDEVEQGQALMSLYNPNLDPNILLNLAKLESIKAQIVQVKRDVANLKELRRKNSTSKNTLEHKETDYKDLIAQEKLIQAQIDLAQANQLESIILAPFVSTIVMIDKQVGEFVQAGQVVMSVYQQDILEVEVNITKLLWKNLKVNDLIAGVYDNQTVKFKIIELAQTADANSHLMKVILQLTTAVDKAIGQQVVLKFPQKYNNVYQLPLEVVVDDGINQPYLFSSVDGKAMKNYIKPLFIEKGQIVFTSHDEIKGSVVIKGQSKISTGMRLQEIQ
ncbi:MAG: efflux RND transporter periplasmic adaptor subunit [Alcanivoracaceae bacterium]|nr:efflux RND transporter periplasmic adaptor subunit [Alcanivoracaceae bacterium]